MERCINVVFMNLFVNINKQYQNNCLSIIHFKSFTDGSFKFSPTRYNRYVSVQFQFIQNQIFIFVIACGEKYSLWTYDFELEICPEGIMYPVSKYSSSLISNRRFS